MSTISEQELEEMEKLHSGPYSDLKTYRLIQAYRELMWECDAESLRAAQAEELLRQWMISVKGQYYSEGTVAGRTEAYLESGREGDSKCRMNY